MKSFNNLCNVGILGDGQLARMLTISAHQRGLTPWVLSENHHSPAGLVCSHVVYGTYANLSAVLDLFKKVDILTFESEFVPLEILQKLEQALEENPKKKIFPAPKVIAQIQDRRSQKDFLIKHKIPTSPFVKVSTPAHLAEAVQTLGLPLVLKKHLGGYDGYGTFILKNKKDVQKFLSDELTRHPFFIAEKWISFKKELAICFARNMAGDIVALPLVETQQTQSRCDWVMGPFADKKIQKASALLQKRIAAFLKAIDYVGLIAFELFVTEKNELLVNEIAPRVHNSAHYSLDALNHSQFDCHWMCATQKTFPVLSLKNAAFAMTNILGPQKGRLNLQKPITGQLHWYGKAEAKAGRKMGHVNYVGQNPQKLLQKAQKERSQLYEK